MYQQKVKTSIIKNLSRRGLIRDNISFKTVQSLLGSLIEVTDVLTEKEKDVLRKRIFQFMTQREIARQYKVTPQWIMQLEHGAMAKLSRNIFNKQK